MTQADLEVTLGVAVDISQKYQCSVCGFSGRPDRMYNPSRRYTNGNLVVFCGRCARLRPHGVTLYRLIATLKQDAERKRRLFKANSIFAIIKAKAEAEKETAENKKRGNASTSSRCLLGPANKSDAISDAGQDTQKEKGVLTNETGGSGDRPGKPRSKKSGNVYSKRYCLPTRVIFKKDYCGGERFF